VGVKQAMCHSRGRSLLFAILAALSILCCPAASAQTGTIDQNFAASLAALPAENLAVTGAFHVPVHSSVKRIGYFDTSGKMVDSCLKSPVALKRLATVEVFIAANDVRGVTGANSVLDRAATGDIEPTVEALMVGGADAGRYAFTSQGRPIRIIKN